MHSKIRILLVEDSRDDERLLLEKLEMAGYAPSCCRVEDAKSMALALETGVWDIIISDYNLPRFRAEDALEILRASGRDIPFIIVSGAIGEERAVAAMKAGAHDYVMKDKLARLAPAIERELREVGVRAQHSQAEMALRHMALSDALTDLPNRTLLLDRLAQALLEARRLHRQLAVFMIDLDRFKEINDAFGHAYGDEVLKLVAVRLRQALRASDTVARLGGDEFAVILPTCVNAQDAESTAIKLLRALEEPFSVDGQTLYVGGSIGVVIFPDHGEDIDTLLRRADIAMYAAKRDGDGWSTYRPNQDEQAASVITLATQLREALQNDELVAFYQPKIDLRTNEVVGVEALVRWRHPEMGMVLPGRFIPLAEHTGLIKPLSMWMLETVLDQSRIWHGAHLDLKVAVNMSMRMLHDPRLPRDLAKLMSACSIPAGALQLEITETVLMTNPARTMEVIDQLSDMGIQFSIDDFGTGYSSLAYLQRLPVQELKIDQSFVSRMDSNENDAVIVHSTIDLAHNLGLQVVAEGVESQQTWIRLAELECDLAQGFYFGEPMAAADLERWLLSGPSWLASSQRPAP